MKGLQAGTDSLPALALSDDLAGVEPVPQGRLDRVLDARSVEKIEDVPSEERAVEACFEVSGREVFPHVVHHGRQRFQCPVGVMNVAVAIDDGQQLARLGQVGGQRVVGLVLGMVGVETPLGAFRKEPRPQHRAIEIDRDARQAGTPCGVVRHLAKQTAEPVAHVGGRLLQRVRHGAVGGKPMETREAQKQRIVLQQAQVSQPRAAEQEHPHQRQRDAERSVVAIEPADREHVLESFGKARAIEEAPKQFDAAVRAELLFGENDRKIGLDAAANSAFLSSHDSGPFGGGGCVRTFFLPPTGPLSIRAFHYRKAFRIRARSQCLRRPCISRGRHRNQCRGTHTVRA